MFFEFKIYYHLLKNLNKNGFLCKLNLYKKQFIFFTVNQSEKYFSNNNNNIKNIN